MQGLAYFPGIQQVLDCSINFVHGISPSVAELTIAPQFNFTAEGGTLQFAFADVLINFPGCKVDAHSLERNSRGEVWHLSIYDRRWRWGWGQISGSYNLRREDGTLRTDTEKNPQELATLCLQAMGETGFDVSALPNFVRPTVEWDGEVPAEALAELCDEFSCRVVLGLDNIVRIWPVGVGAALPVDSTVLENSLTIDPPEKPDKLAVRCGYNLYQCDFELEAVGLDIDGQVKLIKDLSYRFDLAGGGSGKVDEEWSDIDLPYFSRMVIGSGGNNSRKYVYRTELAKRTVFKWYRVKVPAEVPGYGMVTRLDQIVLFDEQLLVQDPPEGETLPEGTPQIQRPAIVFGAFFESLDTNFNSVDKVRPIDEKDEAQTDGGAQNVRLNALYRRGFSLDSERAIVMFGDYVYRNKTADGAVFSGSPSSEPGGVTIAPAQLRLRTSCAIRDKDTRAFARYTRERATGGNFNTPTRFIAHDEIALTHIPTYNDQSYALEDTTKNQAEVDQECDYYLDAAQHEYQATLPQSIVYAGLKAISPDGAIQQLVLSIGPRGATSVAVRNTEVLHRVLSYRERRNLERARQSKDALKKQKAEAWKKRQKAEALDRNASRFLRQ